MREAEEVAMSDEVGSDEVDSDEGLENVDEAAKEEKSEVKKWGAEEWMRQCSKHLSHIEKRLMGRASTL